MFLEAKKNHKLRENYENQEKSVLMENFCKPQITNLRRIQEYEKFVFDRR